MGPIPTEPSGFLSSDIEFIVTGHKETLAKYVRELCRELIHDHSKDRGKKPTSEARSRLTERHRPKQLGNKDNGKAIHRRCHVCYNTVRTSDRIERRTMYGCLECDKALCIDPCWTIYHFEKNACKCC